MRTIRDVVVIDGITWRVVRVTTTTIQGVAGDPFEGPEFAHGEIVRRVTMGIHELPSRDEFMAMTPEQFGVLLERAEDV